MRRGTQDGGADGLRDVRYPRRLDDATRLPGVHCLAQWLVVVRFEAACLAVRLADFPDVDFPAILGAENCRSVSCVLLILRKIEMSLSEQYDSFYKSELVKESFRKIELRGWPRNRVEAILHDAGSGDTVLDVGCGNGHLLYQLADRYRNLVGLEYSAHRLEHAKLNLPKDRFTPVLGSAEDMSELATGSIDCIVSADTIEHIPDVYRAADELFRVLKAGGKLVMNTPNIAFLKKRVLLMLGRFPSTSQPNEGLGNDILFDGGHLHYFTYRSLSLLLERVGFEIEKRVGYGALGRVHDIYPPLLSGGVQLVASKSR